jgi:hypothetical protein
MKKLAHKPAGAIWKSLADDRSGVALIEFAFAAPILMTMLVSGVEVSNYALVNTAISQVGMQLADNGTRIGTRNDDQIYQLNESQVNDILDGADQHAGAKLDIYGEHTENGETKGNGKVVITSVIEMDKANPDDAPLYRILWQRCRGESDYEPAYGRFNEPSGVDMEDGIGPEGQKAAPPDTFNQLIFVEVHYRYQPIFFTKYLIRDYSDISTTAAMLVRDNREEEAPTNNAAAYEQCDAPAPA